MADSDKNVDLDFCLETAVNIAEEAGKIIQNAIGQSKNVEIKESYADLVTETDKQVEELLIGTLKKKFPSHKFIGEESTSQGLNCELTDEPTWIIDPVDGTMNFVHRFPYVAVSIGLTVNKKPAIGVVYNPVLDRMYTARKGQGAFCNGNKLHVSTVEDISKALVVTEFGNNRKPEVMDVISSNIGTLYSKAHGIRCMGSAALNMCTVASGEADVYYEFGIHCWDMAASALIVQEAGGVSIDTEGGPLDLMSRRILCAGSLTLAESLSKLLKHLTLERD